MLLIYLVILVGYPIGKQSVLVVHVGGKMVAPFEVACWQLDVSCCLNYLHSNLLSAGTLVFQCLALSSEGSLDAANMKLIHWR